MVDKWIQKTNLKYGALSRQLGIPVEENIPFTLLEVIVKAKVGDWVENPTYSGKAGYRVTALMKKRCVLALNLKRIKRK